MGCTRSKIAATVSPEGNTTSGSQASSTAPSPEDTEATHTTSSGATKDKSVDKNHAKSTTRGKSAGKNNKSSLGPILHTDLLPDIGVFSTYDCESADLVVNNAKPRLNCPGIGRAVRLAPIVPGVEQPSWSTHGENSVSKPLEKNNLSQHSNGCNPPFGDQLLTDSSSGKVSQPNSDLGFYHNRHPPVSVSPRNSISRTTMKTGLTPDSSGIFSNYGGSEFSPLNTSRSSFLPASRASSARTGSVLTTNALNTSFMTSVDGDDDFGHETTLENCQLDTTDAGSEADAGSRAASSTPMLRLQGEGFIGMPPDVGGIGTIVEEYEGGFTPRGFSKDVSAGELKTMPQTKLPHFTPKEIDEHNDREGTIDWCMYLRKVYDVPRLKNTFEPIISDIRQKEENCHNRKQTLNRDIVTDIEYEFFNMDSSSDEDDESNCNAFPCMDWNNRSVYNLVRAGLDKATLQQFLGACCVGIVVQPDEGRYWDDIRSDVRKVLDDLIRSDAKDTISNYSAEYMHLLQRWIAKYRQINPIPKPIQSNQDMNEQNYPLPEEIARNPEVLRQWLDAWEKFDLELPESGTAWHSTEPAEEPQDLDAHEIFVSSLRLFLQESPPFDCTIADEAGWRTIPQNLFADDVMTEQQVQTENTRRLRTDLFDPESMKKRRSRLMEYFLNKYDMDRGKVEHFLNWAEEMQKGEGKLLRLCE